MARLCDDLIADRSEIATLFTPDLPVISADNVARYYWSHKKDEWRQGDFPALKSPFRTFWMEYSMPTKGYTEELGEFDIPNVAGIRIGAYIGAKKKDTIAVTLYIFKGTQILKSYIRVHEMDSNGTMIRALNPLPLAPETDDLVTVCMNPILLTISFMNCHNIEVVTVHPPVGLQKSRRKKNKPPLQSYKVINILGLGEKRRERAVRATGCEGDVALHIRRGHFAKYGETNGLLFGKYSGLFWKPQAVVGTAKAGISLHDYVVKTQ